MKAAAVYPGRKSLDVLTDFPEPVMRNPGDVKLRILHVGVCGTDREIASFLYGTPPEGSDYLVPGHESIGEVIDVGPEVEHLKPGDIAIPMVRRPCHHPDCAACRAGRQDFCYTGDYRERGIMKMHGFMTERVVDDAAFMNAVPGAIREVAVLAEPLTIAEKALLQVLETQRRLPFTRPPGNAVVLGAGPVGLLGAMALQLHGYQVIVYSREREPNPAAGLVRAIGGQYISSQDCDAARMAAQAGRIDLVYEATGVSRFAFDVLKVLGHNGVFILTGVPRQHGPTPVDTDAIMRDMVLKNQCLLGTVNAGKDAFEHAIADLEEFYTRWPASVGGLITGRFPLERFAEPIRRQTGIKNIIEIGR